MVNTNKENRRDIHMSKELDNIIKEELMRDIQVEADTKPNGGKKY